MLNEQCLTSIYVLRAVFLQGCRRILVLLLFAVCTATLQGCIPYKCTTSDYIAWRWEQEDTCCEEAVAASYREQEGEFTCHWLYRVIPRHRCMIRWYDLPHWLTWALLGNDDDGIFGEAPTADYCCDACPGQRALLWGLRNPLHNFSFYVAGSAGCCNSQITLLSLSPCGLRMLQYQRRADTVFVGERSSLYLALHGWKPFISMRMLYLPCRRADFYLGWRERGNFGAKVQPFKSR